MRSVTGYPLRWAMTLLMAEDRREWTIPELVAGLELLGLEPPGRPSKAASDALRGEVRKGRVVRVGRGRYRFAYAPKSTMSRMRKGVRRARGLE